MKALSLTVLLSLILHIAWAQSTGNLITLKGSVVDSTSGKAMAFATLAVQNAKTKTSVKNFLSKEDGSFEFSLSDSLDYLLVIAFTGYNNKIIPLKEEDLPIWKNRISSHGKTNERSDSRCRTARNKKGTGRNHI